MDDLEQLGSSSPSPDVQEEPAQESPAQDPPAVQVVQIQDDQWQFIAGTAVQQYTLGSLVAMLLAFSLGAVLGLAVLKGASRG